VRTRRRSRLCNGDSRSPCHATRDSSVLPGALSLSINFAFSHQWDTFASCLVRARSRDPPSRISSRDYRQDYRQPLAKREETAASRHFPLDQRRNLETRRVSRTLTIGTGLRYFRESLVRDSRGKSAENTGSYIIRRE
jgi:hypothetical protein